MKVFQINSDAFLQKRNGKWLFSNPRTKSHVALDANAYRVLSELLENYTEQHWSDAFKDASGSDWTNEFFGSDGLHTDHTGIKVSEKVFSGLELFKLLKKRWLIVNKDEYEAYFAQLSSVLDRAHLGTFHQRVGQYLTVEKRIGQERWNWWHEQKFTKDGLAVKAGPYKDIQENYFDNYFSEINIRNLNVLDFGCGNGYYSAKLAKLGAKVLGIDTSEELIQIANKNHSDTAKFIHINPEKERLSELCAEPFDMIFMQDVLLILMKPENGKPIEELGQLLLELRSVLKTGAKLCTMEPNSIFWLAGRYGDINNSYAVVTEYKKQIFNVVPLLTDVTRLMKKSGFALIEYEHPEDRTMSNKYANDYCIWDFFCFQAI